MDDHEFERRFLEFVHETDVPITAASLAYFAGFSIRETDEGLQRLVSRGVIQLDSSPDGDLFYVFPNRAQLPRSKRASAVRASAGAPTATASPPFMVFGGGEAHSTALVDLGATALLGSDTPAGADSATDKACPFCGEVILRVARKCKHCGELLDPNLRRASGPTINVGIQQVSAAPAHAARAPLTPGLAALFSLVWPGAGQMYCGRVGAGVGWMLAALVGYILIVPGLVIHLMSIFDAARAARDENAKGGG